MKIAKMEVTCLGSFGDDLTVVNAARVSFDKESEWFTPKYIEPIKILRESDAKLIKYLADHKHFSPFNHAFLSFRVKAPIFVARQLVKHKFLPWNEVSRRYVDSEPEFFIPEGFRKKAENVKQGSSDEEVTHAKWELSPVSGEEFLEPIRDVSKAFASAALSHYDVLLRSGVCPEQARMVLPLNLMTEWIWSGTLGAFLDMLVLRLDSHTQKETQEIAKLIAEHVKVKFPASFNARIKE